jgi:hypothetical protein
VERGLSPGSDHQYGVGLFTARQVEEVRARAKGIVGVIRANLEVAGRHHNGLVGKALGQAQASRGGVRDPRMNVRGHVRDRPVRRHVIEQHARAGRSVCAHPDPILRDRVLFRDVGLGDFYVVTHGHNLLLGLRQPYSLLMDITLRDEGSVAVITWNDGENRVNLDSLARLNSLFDELEDRSGPSPWS